MARGCGTSTSEVRSKGAPSRSHCALLTLHRRLESANPVKTEITNSTSKGLQEAILIIASHHGLLFTICVHGTHFRYHFSTQHITVPFKSLRAQAAPITTLMHSWSVMIE